jgi:hypothetical protein
MENNKKVFTRYYIAKALGKVYAVTIAMMNVDGETHVGIAYQGKKDGFDKSIGEELAVHRLNRNPAILYKHDRHYNLNSAIMEDMPKHIRKCVTIMDHKQYVNYRNYVKSLAKHIENTFGILSF